MADLVTLAIAPRDNAHKGTLRRLRDAGEIPAVLYGKQLEPRPVQVKARDLAQALRGHGQGALLELTLEGEQVTAVIKETQLDPVTGRLAHLAFQRVSREDRITTSVPLVFVGDTTAITDQGGVLEHPASDVTVSCRADHLPESITVDLSGLTIGHSLRVADIVPPEGVEITSNPEQVIAATSVSAAAQREAGLEAAETETAGAETATE